MAWGSAGALYACTDGFIKSLPDPADPSINHQVTQGNPIQCSSTSTHANVHCGGRPWPRPARASRPGSPPLLTAAAAAAAAVVLPRPKRCGSPPLPRRPPPPAPTAPGWPAAAAAAAAAWGAGARGVGPPDASCWGAWQPACMGERSQVVWGGWREEGVRPVPTGWSIVLVVMHSGCDRWISAFGLILGPRPSQILLIADPNAKPKPLLKARSPAPTPAAPTAARASTPNPCQIRILPRLEFDRFGLSNRDQNPAKYWKHKADRSQPHPQAASSPRACPRAPRRFLACSPHGRGSRPKIRSSSAVGYYSTARRRCRRLLSLQQLLSPAPAKATFAHVLPAPCSSAVRDHAQTLSARPASSSKGSTWSLGSVALAGAVAPFARVLALPTHSNRSNNLLTQHD